MRFFTLDRYHEWYRRGSWVGLKRALREYRSHLRAAQLPDAARSLASLAGTDDGLLVEGVYAPRRRELTLTLRCGDVPRGYFDLVLNYREADLAPAHEATLARIARTTLDDSRFSHDLFIHEVDLGPDGRLVHRLLWHPGIWFEVDCLGLDWTTEPQANRTLPALRRRFRRAPKGHDRPPPARDPAGGHGPRPSTPGA
jgi:hypothetical protein